MAGLKQKKKEKSTSPNLVLVIFLVMFVISNIVLGVLFYYALEDKDESRRTRKIAVDNLKAEKDAVTYFRMLYRDSLLPLGGNLTVEEIGELRIDREAFRKGNFDKVAATTKDPAVKLRNDLALQLGGETDDGYARKYPELLAEAKKKIADIEGKIAAAVAQHEKTKELLKELTKKQEEILQAGGARITQGNAAALAEAQKRSDDFKKSVDNVAKLNQELLDKRDEIAKLEDDHKNALLIRDQKLKTLEAGMKELAGLGGQGGAANQMVRGDSFPLLLDISTGKPLWDHPVGKITRVDFDLRQVVINVGTVHGAKPELTFNIFGAGPTGRAEGKLKGTIEIIKVLDTNSSLARITSLAVYDSEGREVPLNAQTLGRIQRDADDVLPREGDLLFNLFWGTRVAVAGYVSVTGEPSANPAEQMRQMEDFMDLLRRNGVRVDAYVDLRDGVIRGNLTSKTRYLIRGDDLLAAVERKPAAPKMPAEDKDKEAADKEEKKDPAPKEPAANADRNEQITKSVWQLRDDAKAMGLLMISAENFATVIGYRKARSANSVEITSFRPSLPYAGSVDAGVVRQPPPPEAKAPEMEKKAVEEKKAPEEKKAVEPEKKDAN